MLKMVFWMKICFDFSNLTLQDRYCIYRCEKAQRDIISKDGDQQVIAKRIHQPVLVLWGAKDRLLSVDNVPEFEKLIPHAKSLIFDDIGHLPMAEAPERTAQALVGLWQSR